MNKLYNEEIKERFLTEQYENEATRITIRNVFYKTELIESVLDKDLFECTLEELGKCIENTNPHTNNVARSNGRFISQYISWAIEQRLRKNTINPLKGVLPEFYDKFVDHSRKIHYSIGELIDLLENEVIYNQQDKSLLFLMFEGVIGEQFSQLRELKYSDIDFENKTVFVKERDYYVPVHEKCIEYLERTRDEKTYYQYNNNTKEFAEKLLLESDYVFRNIQSPRGVPSESVKQNVIYKRIHTIKELLGLHIMTPNSLKQSGMIFYSVQEYLKAGELGYDQLAVVCQKYDYSTITSGDYTYFNTHLLREFVSESNIKDLYDLDLVIDRR